MFLTDRMGALAAAAALGVMLAGPALGHGGGGGASNNGGSSSHASTAGGTGGGRPGSAGAAGDAAGGGDTGCHVGFVLKHGQCRRITSGILPDDTLYEQGRAMALAGRYAASLPILEAVRRQDDPMVLTMRGFAMRKLGRMAQALALYDRALAIDPGNVNTHEYLGEAYVTQGRIELARAELAKVERGCGAGCEQYDDLARAIETGQTD